MMEEIKMSEKKTILSERSIMFGEGVPMQMIGIGSVHLKGHSKSAKAEAEALVAKIKTDADRRHALRYIRHCLRVARDRKGDTSAEFVRAMEALEKRAQGENE
jgi:hypothetical protein